jgi:hypothetical protein
MNLEQFNLTYFAQEDRILFRIGFSATPPETQKQEIKIIFTRRLVKLLWPTLIEALITQMRIDRPEAALASHDLVQIEHQHCVEHIAANGQFAQAYDAKYRSSPLGDEALLLDSVKFHLDAKQAIGMQLITLTGTSIDLKLPIELMHGFCKLLQEAVKAAQWDLELTSLETELSADCNRITSHSLH